MRITVMLLIGVVVAMASCATGRTALRQATEGSCQRLCEDQHRDSLYDRNRCLENCEPP